MSQLFDPGRIGSLRLTNRLVRSATAESLADLTGRPAPALARLYRALAEGGVGLVVTGHMYVHPSGRAHPGMTGIHDDGLLPDLRRLADAAHEGGAKIAAQINHAGRQTRDPAIAEPLAPSDAFGAEGHRVARGMTIDEIRRSADAYGAAAGRARAAGFDAVQIHAAHGYLVGQFLSPAANRRTDEWGGSIDGHARFLETVAAVVRREVGPAYPVFVKLGFGDEPPDGLTIDDAVEVAGRLERFRLDGIEISGGIASSRDFNIRLGVRPGDGEAYFRSRARRARAATDLPLLLVGGLRSRAVMDDVLRSGDADFVSLCRPLICESDLPNRLAAGQPAAACVSGNRCWPERSGDSIACKCPTADRPEAQ